MEKRENSLEKEIKVVSKKFLEDSASDFFCILLNEEVCF